MTPNKPCPVCNATVTKHFLAVESQLASRREYNLLQCAACTHIFLAETPRTDELKDFYSQKYKPYNVSCSSLGSRNHLRAAMHRHIYGPPRSLNWFAQRLQWLVPNYPSYVPNGLLLDIGCGAGTILAEQQQLGWRCEGLDMEPSIKERLAQKGIIVHIGDALSVLRTLPPQHYDAVLSCHSLEHFALPRDVICEVWRILRPQGVFVVTVPNADSWLAHRYAQTWFAQECPGHLQIFSTRSLSTLLSLNRFRIEKTFCSEISLSFANLYGGSGMLRKCGAFFAVAAELHARCANMFNQGDAITLHARKLP